eukprot:1134369-Lingulodinium_polyedra.AAC.1
MLVNCTCICRTRARTAGTGVLTPRVCMPTTAPCATPASSTLCLGFPTVGKRSTKPCRSMP